MEKKRSDSVQYGLSGMKFESGIVKRNSVPTKTSQAVRFNSAIQHSASVGSKSRLWLNRTNGHLDNNNMQINTVLIQSVVAYIGSYHAHATDKEIPQKSISAMQSCINKLRKEQYIHQRVLMKVSTTCVKLSNADSDVIAVYNAHDICFTSVCPTDKRFFCIVTYFNEAEIQCHEFMVDSNIQNHTTHAEIAKRFSVHCSMDTESGHCIEFPNSPRVLYNMIQSLFISRENSNGIFRENSNISATTTDSGLGFSFDGRVPFDKQRQMQIQELKLTKKNKKSNRTGNSFFSRHGKRSSSRGEKTNLRSIISKSSESIPLSDTGTLSGSSSIESVSSNVSLPSVGNGKLTVQTSLNMGKETVNNGRVPLWAISFDRLLEDPEGVKYLTEFLRKEFSEENILFWMECERLRKMSPEEEKGIQDLATSIYDRFLSNEAPSPINIDSKGQRIADESQNQSAHSDMYEYQQMQIYKLMKLDSYGRFLKSPLYRQCIVNEMEGRALPLDIDSDSASLKSQTPSEQETGSGKRRFGIFQSSNKSNKSRGSGDSFKMHDSFDNDVGGELGQMPTQEHADLSKICRLELWDGTATVMYAASETTTIRDALGVLCERRGVGLSAIDVFFAGEERSLNLDADINILAGREVVVEKRTLFRLDMLPIRRSVGIKAKSSKTVADVLRPVLEKYGLAFENLQAKVTGEKDRLDMGQLVNVLDNLRVAVDYTPEVKQNDESFKDKRRKSKEKFRTLTKSKGTLSRKDGSNNNDVTKVLNKNDKNDLLKIMSASQSGKLDDQRGLISEMNLELPDFLKVTSKEDVISQNEDTSSSMTNMSDSSSENFDGGSTNSNDNSNNNNNNINNNNNNVVLRKYRTSVHRNVDGMLILPEDECTENISINIQTKCAKHPPIIKDSSQTNQQYCISQWNHVTPVMSQLPSYHRSFSTNSTQQLLATDEYQYCEFKSLEAEDRGREKRKIKSILV